MNVTCDAGRHNLCAGYFPATVTTVSPRHERVTRTKTTIPCSCSCHEVKS